MAKPHVTPTLELLLSGNSLEMNSQKGVSSSVQSVLMMQGPGGWIRYQELFCRASRSVTTRYYCIQLHTVHAYNNKMSVTTAESSLSNTLPQKIHDHLLELRSITMHHLTWDPTAQPGQVLYHQLLHQRCLSWYRSLSCLYMSVCLTSLDVRTFL